MHHLFKTPMKMIYTYCNEDDMQEAQEEICTCPTCTVSQFFLQTQFFFFWQTNLIFLPLISNFFCHIGILRGFVWGVHGEGGEGEGAPGQEHGCHYGVHPTGGLLPCGGGGAHDFNLILCWEKIWHSKIPHVTRLRRNLGAVQSCESPTTGINITTRLKNQNLPLCSTK